jgi:soluble lytic murein transglycosylase-like protein
MPAATPARASGVRVAKRIKTGPPKTPYDAIIRQASKRYKIDANLITAIIKVESDFNPRCRSHKGAIGLMQLMPKVARLFKVKRIYNPTLNIYAGTHHFKNMLKEFHGNLPLALAAYNAGPRMVRKYKGIPPFPETQNYVRAVLRYHKQYRS